MHGHGWRPGRWATAASVTAVALAAPTPAVAAEPVEILPGVTINAVAADLDDDGAREVVRIIEAGPNATAVDVWREARDGWLSGGSAPLVSPDEIGNDTLADRALGAGTLLAVRREGRDRVLALTAQGIPGDQVGRICCLALAEVRLRGERDIVLEPLVADGLDQSAAGVQAIDLDGDGTDELATMAVDFDADGSWLAARLGVLAWVNGAFGSIGQVPGPTDVTAALAGDTNGAAGIDLHLGIAEHGNLMRVALVDGALVVEESHIDIGESGGWIAGIADGAIVLSTQAGVRIVRWLAGGEAHEVGRLPLSPFPWVNVVGTGRDALIIHEDETFGTGPPSFTVYDLERRRLGDAPAAPGSRGLWQMLNGAAGIGIAMDRYLYPYFGPLPDRSFGNRAAFAASGSAIVQDGEGGFETHPISELAGMNPIGIVGRNEGWLAIGEGVALGSSAYLQPGALMAFGAGRMVLGPVDTILAAAGPAPTVSVELRGAVVTAPDDEDGRLLAGPDGFEAVVSAPPGSLVIRGARGVRPEQHDVADAPVTVQVRPPGRGSQENRDFEAVVTVFTPDGRTTLVELRGTFVREPPELSARADTEAFALAARIRGGASPDTVVMIGGRPINVESGGTFEVVVDAPIWPEDMVVTARDPLGNEVSRRLQVVGFVDYRGLPWVPIFGAATIGAGAYVFLRAPRRRPEVAPAWSGDGSLEEIDAD